MAKIGIHGLESANVGFPTSTFILDFQLSFKRCMIFANFIEVPVSENTAYA